MPKPSTGRIRPVAQPAPEPDTEQMTTDTLMTSVFSGVWLIVASLYFAVFGSIALYAGRAIADVTGAKLGLLVGLLIGLAVAVFLLRRYSQRIKARSRNLYRGAWIGTLLAVSIILVMAYAPGLMPNYCPPGAICQ
jgi:hypothetical protein